MLGAQGPQPPLRCNCPLINTPCGKAALRALVTLNHGGEMAARLRERLWERIELMSSFGDARVARREGRGGARRGDIGEYRRKSAKIAEYRRISRNIAATILRKIPATLGIMHYYMCNAFA